MRGLASGTGARLFGKLRSMSTSDKPVEPLRAHRDPFSLNDQPPNRVYRGPDDERLPDGRARISLDVNAGEAALLSMVLQHLAADPPSLPPLDASMRADLEGIRRKAQRAAEAARRLEEGLTGDPARRPLT